MKTVTRHEQKDYQVIRKIFELQIELEQMNTQPHDCVSEVRMIIDSIDEMFERLMNKE